MMRSVVLVFGLSLSLLASGVGGCIDEEYVPGGACLVTAGCPPPDEEGVVPISPVPEQCVQTGVAGEQICLPMPATRTVTSCTGQPECLAAGFPVEVQCVADLCQCEAALTTQCTPWNPQTCACGT